MLTSLFETRRLLSESHRPDIHPHDVAAYPGNFSVTNGDGKLVSPGEMFLRPQHHTSSPLPAGIAGVPGSMATGNPATT